MRHAAAVRPDALHHRRRCGDHVRELHRERARAARVGRRVHADHVRVEERRLRRVRQRQELEVEIAPRRLAHRRHRFRIADHRAPFAVAEPYRAIVLARQLGCRVRPARHRHQRAQAAERFAVQVVRVPRQRQRVCARAAVRGVQIERGVRRAPGHVDHQPAPVRRDLARERALLERAAHLRERRRGRERRVVLPVEQHVRAAELRDAVVPVARLHALDRVRQEIVDVLDLVRRERLEPVLAAEIVEEDRVVHVDVGARGRIVPVAAVPRVRGYEPQRDARLRLLPFGFDRALELVDARHPRIQRHRQLPNGGRVARVRRRGEQEAQNDREAAQEATHDGSLSNDACETMRLSWCLSMRAHAGARRGRQFHSAWK
ncbi:Uncharacterised protein [Burkholderia pseudomallei]|nr:Uncharacterised protein [Burkholderia pseudomallei]